MSRRLFKDTSFFQAVEHILAKIREEAAQRDLKDLKAYLVGGVAIHILTGSRSSVDVDVLFDGQPFTFPEETDELFMEFLDADGSRKTVFYDTHFRGAFSLLHSDYGQRALLLKHDTVMPVYVLDPVDIALMKMSRFIARDQEDIRKLIELRMLNNPEMLEALTKEALPDYVGDSDRVLSTLSIVKRWIDDARQESFPHP